MTENKDKLKPLSAEIQVCPIGYVKFSIGNEFQQHEVIGNIYENPELLEAADA